MPGINFFTLPLGGDAIEWGALPLRLGLGAVFMHSGYGKFRRGVSGTGRWMEGLGLPLPQLSARLVAATELVGGLLLTVGLLVPWVGLALAGNMLVATWVEKTKIGAPFQGSDSAQGYELTIILGLAALALVFLGAGALSLDAILEDAFAD